MNTDERGLNKVYFSFSICHLALIYHLSFEICH
jgi:hypothetical protein